MPDNGPGRQKRTYNPFFDVGKSRQKLSKSSDEGGCPPVLPLPFPFSRLPLAGKVQGVERQWTGVQQGDNPTLALLPYKFSVTVIRPLECIQSRSGESEPNCSWRPVLRQNKILGLIVKNNRL